MNRITVTSQEELDDFCQGRLASTPGDGYGSPGSTDLIIDAHSGVIEIKDFIYLRYGELKVISGRVILVAEISIFAYNVSCISLIKGAVTAYDQVSVEAFNDTVVTGKDFSKIKCWDKTSAYGFNTCKIRSYDESSVTLSDKSYGVAVHNSKVWSFHDSSVIAYDSSYIKAYDRSKVEATDRCSKVTICKHSKDVDIVSSGNTKVKDYI
jgi:hypothetical protein